MRLHRPKTEHTRGSNEAEVGRYANRLERAFKAWIGSGQALVHFTDEIDQAAREAFPVAFLRGKRQALPASTLDSHNQRQVAVLVDSNSHFVRFSLETAIEQRRQLAEVVGEDVSKVLNSAFASRVRLQYGGRLWQVMEAGYHAGVQELAQRVRMKMRQPVLAQAVASPFEDDLLDTVSDSSLADALGLTLTEFLNLFAPTAGGLAVQPMVRIGTQYVTEGDDAVCDPCQANADGGDDGVYWLPDDPPLPGESCTGMQNCRCFLQTVTEID